MKWPTIRSASKQAFVARGPVRDSVATPRLNATLLLASTINEDGNMELPERGDDGRLVTAIYELDGEGNLQRRRDGVRAEFDMLAFSESLNLLFGDNTPALFRLHTAGDGNGIDHTLADEASDRLRHETIRNAFNVYLMAYEERLV
ncbi:MAG TPA: hypothetical protein VF190_09835 [Rhodothermales bacterium]